MVLSLKNNKCCLRVSFHLKKINCTHKLRVNLKLQNTENIMTTIRNQKDAKAGAHYTR